MNKKPLYLILGLIFLVIFGLLIYALYNYSYVNENRLFLDTSYLKFIIFGIIILLFFLLIIYITVNKKLKKKTLEKEILSSFGRFSKRENQKRKDKILNSTKNYAHGDNNVVVKVNNKGSISNNIKVPFVAPAETKENKDVEETSDSRFYMLNQIDLEYAGYEKYVFESNLSLKQFCEDFRNYAAYKLKLYYDIKDIRRFVAGLSVTKLIILQGMSGTGKTSLAYAFGEFVQNKTIVVPIQPMWKERTDLIGYYNEFTRKFNETTLLYKMYEANYNSQVYITVLDEMNIARVEYYFAEFLSLLELPNPEGRNLDVVSDVWDTDPKLLKKGKLRLPVNMWFIGTANNDDSTFAISDKVYDRAIVLNLDNKAVPFDGKDIPEEKITSDYLERQFNSARKEYKISARNERRLELLDKYLIEKFHITFGNRIMKQIKAYVPVLVSCGGTEIDALDDIISRKILRKLESKNPVYVKSQAQSLCNFLDDLFGVDKMINCKNTILTIEQNA